MVNVKQTPNPQWTKLMEQLAFPIVLVLWCEHMVGNGMGSPGPDRREEGVTAATLPGELGEICRECQGTHSRPSIYRVRYVMDI